MSNYFGNNMDRTRQTYRLSVSIFIILLIVTITGCQGANIRKTFTVYDLPKPLNEGVSAYASFAEIIEYTDETAVATVVSDPVRYRYKVPADAIFGSPEYVDYDVYSVHIDQILHGSGIEGTIWLYLDTRYTSDGYIPRKGDQDIFVLGISSIAQQEILKQATKTDGISYYTGAAKFYITDDKSVKSIWNSSDMKVYDGETIDEFIVSLESLKS